MQIPELNPAGPAVYLQCEEAALPPRTRVVVDRFPVQRDLDPRPGRFDEVCVPLPGQIGRGSGRSLQPVDGSGAVNALARWSSGGQVVDLDFVPLCVRLVQWVRHSRSGRADVDPGIVARGQFPPLDPERRIFELLLDVVIEAVAAPRFQERPRRDIAGLVPGRPTNVQSAGSRDSGTKSFGGFPVRSFTSSSAVRCASARAASDGLAEPSMGKIAGPTTYAFVRPWKRPWVSVTDCPAAPMNKVPASWCVVPRPSCHQLRPLTAGCGRGVSNGPVRLCRYCRVAGCPTGGGGPARSAARSKAALSISCQRTSSAAVAARCTYARRCWCSSVSELRSIQLFAGSAGLLWSPSVSPMHRSTMVIQSGSWFARICASVSMSGTCCHMLRSGSMPPTAAAESCRWNWRPPDPWPRTRNAVVSTSGGGPGGSPRAARRIRTVML